MKEWMKSYGVTIQMKATEQYFPVVLYIMLYKVVLTFESVDEIHKFDCWDDSYWAVPSYGTTYYALQVCSKEGYWAQLSCSVVYYEVQGGPV